MTHDMIVRKLKAMRMAELDEHRSNLELYLRESYPTEAELSAARYELNLVECEMDERDTKERMLNIFRIHCSN